MDKEVELKKAIKVKNKDSSEQVNIVRIRDEEYSSSSSTFVYNIESDKRDSETSSRQTPNLIPEQPE